MKIFNEQAIKDNLTETIPMLELWKELSQQTFGTVIEVGIANRQEHDQLKHVKGELNTGYIHNINGKTMLVIYVNSTKNVQDIIVSHEIGHWALKLQGYKAMKNKDTEHSFVEVLLNSMCHHIPLYKLQREQRADPQPEIDNRTKHNRKLFSNENESKTSIVQNVLLATDDLLNCSDFRKKKYLKVLKRKHPRTYKDVQILLELATSYELTKSTENGAFAKKVLELLDVEGNWDYIDEIPTVKKLIVESESGSSKKQTTD